MPQRCTCWHRVSRFYFNKNIHLNKVVYTTGNMYSDGGWFASGLKVQVRSNFNWVDVTNIEVKPIYPYSNTAGPNKSYTFTFDDTTGDAVRIIGAPGGTAHFTTMGELAVYYTVTDADQLMGHWQMDQTSGTTATDASYCGRDGTLMNGASWTTSGKINEAVSLDGVNDYVSLPNIINPANTDLTAAAWVKMDATPGTYKVIIQQEGTHGRTWLARRDNGKLYTYLGGTEITSTATIPIGSWHHVAVTYDGTTVRLYVDGQQSGLATRVMESETGGMRIGYHKSDTTAGWNGVIDDVRVYGRALSSAEMLDLYNGS